MDSVDRISELPDSVLCEILSYLPTKLSVSTSILAKRWRFLWTEVPNLDLYGEDYPRRPKKFSDVIYRVLLRHKVKAIDTFRLSLARGRKVSYGLETWIAVAIARKVQNFHLYNRGGSLLMLPPCIFTGKIFVDLTLSCCRIKVPSLDEPSFPHLKKLHLEAVGFEDDDELEQPISASPEASLEDVGVEDDDDDEGDNGLQQLISACPVLEELFIDKVWFGDLCSYSISSPTLKRLTVNFQGYYSWETNEKYSYTLEIKAPALSYLRVDDLLSEQISAEELSVLTEADILIKNSNEKDDVDDHSDSVLFFVDELYNVSHLRLSIDHTQFSDESDFSESNDFDNLTKLELSADWRFLTMFLRYADNLEFLIISKVDNEELKCTWMEPEQVPMCLVLHLKTVRIDQFRYAENEFKMVRYILCNAQVLKKMEICFDTQGSLEQEKDSAVERISQFDRASQACELQFH